MCYDLVAQVGRAQLKLYETYDPKIKRKQGVILREWLRSFKPRRNKSQNKERE